MTTGENRVGQDRFFFLNFLFEGLKIGYLTEPTVWIYEHEQNTSSTEYINHSSDKKIKNALTIANGYLDYKHSRITKDIKKTLIEKAASELFWNVGYNIYLNQGDKRKAIITFMQAIRIWPWNLAFWKTLVSTLIKM